VAFVVSLEVTVIDLLSLPRLLPVLRVTLISPSPPGGIAALVMTAAVHPQPPLALITSRGALPSLRTLKLWETEAPRATVPKS